VRNGWTGGQYSIVRAVLGIVLLIYFLANARQWVPLAGALAAIFFIIGWHDRIAAVVMLLVLGWMIGWMAHPLLLLPAVLLVVHLFVPPAPFLSFAARGRVDPRGGWRMPRGLFFWLDPAWIARRAPETTDDVYYDGTCGLCHRGMRWLVAEDPTGTSFRYAPLGGDSFVEAFPDAQGLPDSVIVRTPGGEVLVRSDAAVHLLGRLGGLWRVGGTVFGWLPRRVRDGAYDLVARVRYRIFGRAKDACPLIPPDLRSRFSA
jgi:predicted DCC family thiol-disulfide oxidoreductase YuxK